MTADNERCPKTDMVIDGCWHCGARPGSAIVLPDLEPHPEPTKPQLITPTLAPTRMVFQEDADASTDLNRFRRDLVEIINLASLLPRQAVNDARAKVDGVSLPGGRAMVELAPVANIETWTHQYEFRERRNHEHPELPPLDTGYLDVEDDAQEPVLQLLRYWSDQYRREWSREFDHIPTIHTEARFLYAQEVSHWAVKHETNWDQLTKDINRCRTRLEDVLTAGNRQHKTRVECDRCFGVRRKGCKTEGCTDTEVCSTCRPRLILLIGSADDGSEDLWKCPQCKVRMDRSAMLRAHGRQLMRSEAAKYVSKSEAVSTLRLHGTPERTVRSWFAPPAREHTADRCTVCKVDHPSDEFNVCPTPIEDAAPSADGYQLVDVPCGGALTAVWEGGNPEAVLDSFCDVATHKVWVWWPDLWTKHQILRNKRELEAAARKDRSA